MNPKIEKLKQEHGKNCEKIAGLQERNRKLTEQITKLENNDIVGLVREIGLSPEELAELLNRRSGGYVPPTQETEEYEDEN